MGSNLTQAVRVARMTFPAWLGIGAQRSGTTWFTDLLTQHPQVGVGVNGKKEQHLLHKVGDGVEPPSAYLDLFPADGIRRGDWTPQYLRHASAPAAAARLLAPDVPVLVLLRDPVERFVSAMRLAATAGEVALALSGADDGADLQRLLRRPAGHVGAPCRAASGCR